MPSPSRKMIPYRRRRGDRGRQTRRWLKEIFHSENFRPKKSLGQHFLVNYRFLCYIAALAEIKESDLVVEIGAGTGALTALLAERGAEVLAVEIDAFLCRIAGEYLRDYCNVKVLEKDILEGGQLNAEVASEVKKRLKKKQNLKVVGNLPFNIASATITALLTSPLPVKLMLFTVQEEVAYRLAAGPGSKDYGFLSIMAQVHSEVEMRKRISASAFWPEPEVKAAVVRLLPTRFHLKKILDKKIFTDLVKALFTWRRKTIHSCLLRALAHLSAGRKNKAEVERLLSLADIDPRRRPEDLSLDELIRLSNLLSEET